MNKLSVPDQLTEYPLTRHEEISPDVYVIGFKRPFDFIPGQAVRLGIDSEHPPRIYSICSGVDDDELCILFNIKKGGFLSPRLAGLKRGDPVYVSEPYGMFQCPDDEAWWIAAGTGIAPFCSMVRSGLAEGKTLVHGVRYRNQFYFEDEISTALGPRYHRCCSAEQGPGIHSGRVTDYLGEQADLPVDLLYYICGQADMAVDTRDLLIARGVPFTHIVTEIYF